MSAASRTATYPCTDKGRERPWRPMSLERGTRERLLLTQDGRHAVGLLDAWESRWARLRHFYATNRALLGCTCDDCELTRVELELATAEDGPDSSQTS